MVQEGGKREILVEDTSSRVKDWINTAVGLVVIISAIAAVYWFGAKTLETCPEITNAFRQESGAYPPAGFMAFMTGCGEGALLYCFYIMFTFFKELPAAVGSCVLEACKRPKDN